MKIHVTVINNFASDPVIVGSNVIDIDASNAREYHSIFNLVNKTVDAAAPELTRAEFEQFFLVDMHEDVLLISFPMLGLQYVLTMLENAEHGYN